MSLLGLDNLFPIVDGLYACILTSVTFLIKYKPDQIIKNSYRLRDKPFKTNKKKNIYRF